MTVLWSPSTRRVIWYNGAQSETGLIDAKWECHKRFHAAPIDILTMSQSFTNSAITDWEERRVVFNWKELKPEEKTCEC